MIKSNGRLMVEAAFAQGKMTESKEWRQPPVLPRSIWPSDIDLVFHDKASRRYLFCEFSRNAGDWATVSVGQRLLHESLVVDFNGKAMSALCSHSVPFDGHDARPICTRFDVDTFQVMYFDGTDGVTYGDITNGRYWSDFVLSFYGCEGVAGVTINLDEIKEHVDLIIGSHSLQDLNDVGDVIRERIQDEYVKSFLRLCWIEKRNRIRTTAGRNENP